MRRAHQERWSKVATGTPYEEFERLAAQFVEPIRDGGLSIRIEGGRLQVGGIRSDGYLRYLRRFAVDPRGWSLLARLASRLNDPVLPPHGAHWVAVPTPTSVPDDWERQLQQKRRNADRLR